MLMSLDTSVNRVGVTKLPAARSPWLRVPPQTSRAPAAWPSAISPSTRSICRVLISGAAVTAGSNGLPELTMVPIISAMARNSSATSRCTSARVCARQTCPDRPRVTVPMVMAAAGG